MSGVSIGGLARRRQAEHDAPDRVPADIAAIVTPLVGLPYLYQGQPPADGGLDCFGVVQYVLNACTGIALHQDACGGMRDEDNPGWSLVWQHGQPGDLYQLTQPFDMVMSFQPRAHEHMLREHPERAQCLWLHLALMVSPQLLITSCMDVGVLVAPIGELARRMHVLTIVRHHRSHEPLAARRSV